MRAAHIPHRGPASLIRVGELPTPEPGQRQVRVAVAATSANHVDTFVRSGAFDTKLDFPFVVGRDAVGAVERLGPETSGWVIGERVWTNSLGLQGRQGTAAEFAIVDSDRLYRLPAQASDEAVTVLHPGATAALALHRHAEVRPAETVVIVGAAGNVGSAAVTIAVAAGARVIAVAHAADAEYCRGLGADQTLTPERLAEATLPPADVWLDAAGVNDVPLAVRCLAHRGRLVVLAGMGSQAVLPTGMLYLKDATIRGFTISGATVSELADAAGVVNRLLTAGTLRARRIHELDLADVAQAHELLESGALRGQRALIRVGAPAPAR